MEYQFQNLNLNLVYTKMIYNPIYLQTTGPTQLAWDYREIFGHGVDHHAAGFGSPIGYLKDFSRCLSYFTIDELKAHDIAIGERVKLEYLSGITVEGCLKQVYRQKQRNLILSFEDCRVTDLHGEVMFDPSWGTYDMAVGSRIVSVYGGVADREKLQLYRPTPTTETPQIAPDASLMALYETVDSINRGTSALTAQSREQLLRGLDAYPDEWLLMLEILLLGDERLEPALRNALDPCLRLQPELAALIET